ncbi:MAG: aromatic ring-hydroxylating dioxygenase subunit alpha [Polaromonas sp.]|nr:aromatic ring-hydroxylating dioxygenase subunit alpha [Polaromonas sp.]
MTSFFRNAWYVAALSPQVGRHLKPVKILGEAIVLYRTQDGVAAALEDACPHRKLPLSMGRIKGDAVECGYHGLTFDRRGLCIDAATQERVPPFAKVRSYPVRDQYGLLWIWMGDPQGALSHDILHIEGYGEARWHTTQGDSLLCNCHYLWLVDNLLDPSHVAWVHRTSFAGGGTDNTPLQLTVTADAVVSSRWLLDQPPPPFYAPLVQFSGNADRLQHYEVRFPSMAINRSVYTPAGKGGAGMVPDDDTYVMVSYNLLTPIDEDHTLYFWLQHCNTDAQDDGATTRAAAAAARAAFEEDRMILEAVHVGMKNKTTPTSGLLLDIAANRFRKDLAALIALEQSGQPVAASL